MISNLEALFSNFSGGAPATKQEIALAERSLNVTFEDKFRQFLAVCNGGEGFIRDNYFMFWSASEIAEYNNSYHVKEYAPGLILFGSDGGGEAFAFNMNVSPPNIVKVPFVGMELKYAKSVANTFEDFIGLVENDE